MTIGQTSLEARMVANAAQEERSTFIRRTYAHLAGAIGSFALLEVILFKMPFTPRLLELMLGGRYNWLIVLGLFMVFGAIAEKWARSAQSRTMQYVGLGLYVLIEAIIFLPILFIAAYFTDGNAIPSAALLTLTLFAGLTGTVFITRKDFSFLKTGLTIGAFIALGLIVASIIFGFSMGLIFSVLMVGLAGGYILYYTSNIMHHYRTDQYVAASLALFAAVALMFWYILRIFMSRD